MLEEATKTEGARRIPPARDLWQIPGIVAAIVIFAIAAYIARHPVEEPSSEKADFEALLMAYNQGDTISAAESAERFLARYPASPNEAMARFVYADSRWDLIRNDPAAVIKDLAVCLDSFKSALAGGIPAQYKARALKSIGDIQLRMNLPNDALATYTKLLDDFPDNKQALLDVALAHTCTRPPMLDQAAAFIDRYLAGEELTPREIQRGYLTKARLEAARDDHAAAADSARKVLDAGPDGEITAEASLILSQALSRLGDFQGALDAAEAAATPDASRFEAPLALARAHALWKLGRGDEARQAMDETIFRFPGTAEALAARYKLARFLYDSAQIEAAKDALISLLDDMSAQETIKTEYFDIDDVAELWFAVGREILDKKGSGAVREYHVAALVLMSEGHLLFFDATLYLREAEQLELTLPGLPPAKRLETEGRTKRAYFDAGNTFAKVVKSAAGDIYNEALFHAGHAYYMAGELVPALHYLKEFTRIAHNDKRTPQAMYETADALSAIGNYDAAVAACAENVAAHPSNIFAYRSLLLQGDLYRAEGGDSLADAASVYNTILTDRRFDVDSNEWHRAIFSLGETLYSLGRPEEAVLKLEEALERFPSDEAAPEARYYLALSYRQVGLAHPESRLEFLTKAADILAFIAAPGSKVDPAWSRRAAFLMADCYYDLADYDRAARLYDRAAENYIDTPEATRALFQIANCYYHLGLPDKARATYRRAVFNLNRQKAPVEPGDEFYESIAQWRDGGQA